MLLQGETTSFHRAALARLQVFLMGSYWETKATLVCVLSALFLSLPSYDRFFTDQHDYQPFWNHLAQQVAHPLTPHAVPEKSHEAKIVFRLLPALIGRLMPVDSPTYRVGFIFLVQHVAGYFFYLLTLKWAYRLSQDKVTAFLFTYSFAFVYLGRSFFYELFGFFDGLVFFLMVLALYQRNAWAAFLSLFLAYWTDERAIIASPLVLLFHLTNRPEREPYTVKQMLAQYATYLPYLFFLGLYAGIRLWLAQVYHLKVPVGDEADAGLSLIIQQIIHIPLALFLTYEGYWGLILWLMIYLIARRDFKSLALYGSAFLGVLIISCCVWDITRSFCYAFPLLFIGFRQVIKASTVEYTRALVGFVLITSFLIPTYKYHFHHFFWQLPAVFKVMYHVQH